MATPLQTPRNSGFGVDKWLIDSKNANNALPVRRGDYVIGVRLLCVHKQGDKKLTVGDIIHITIESHTIQSTAYFSKSHTIQPLASCVIGKNDKVTCIRDFTKAMEYFKIDFKQTDILVVSVRNSEGVVIPYRIQMLIELIEV